PAAHRTRISARSPVRAGLGPRAHRPGPERPAPLVMNRPGRLPPPLDLLVAVLPTVDQTDFLLACLAPAPKAVAAWRRWRARPVPTEWLAGRNEKLRGLSALLASSVLAAGAPLDNGDAAWLRTALFHEERRSHTFRAILAEVLAALIADSVPFLLAKGVA